MKEDEGSSPTEQVSNPRHTMRRFARNASQFAALRSIFACFRDDRLVSWRKISKGLTEGHGSTLQGFWMDRLGWTRQLEIKFFGGFIYAPRDTE